MKIALCLRGLVGYSTSTTETNERVPLDPKIGFDLHNSTIIQPNIANGHQVDIFMHCWNEGQEQRLLECYNPKKYLIEKQEQFTTARTTEEGFKPQDVRREFALKSVFASTKKVIELKKEAESEQGFVYDAVILLRYDVGFNPKVVELNIEDYDMKYFYSNYNEDYGLNPRLLKSHVVDYWFMSNSSWMYEYSKLHDVFPVKYNNLIDKNSKRGGLQSAHQIQMDHISTFAKASNRRTILGSPSIVFCRNPQQLPVSSDPIGKKRIKSRILFCFR